MTDDQVRRAVVIAVLTLSPGLSGCSKASDGGGAESSGSSGADVSTSAAATTQGDDGGTTAGLPGTSVSSGSSTGGVVPEALCDGSPDIRLVWASYGEIPNSETQDPAEAVMWENGTGYFYVTGTCEFHVMGRPWRFGADFSGTLTAEQANNLAVDLHYDEWSDFYGMSFSGPPVDGGMRTILGPGGLFRLGIGCKPYSVDLEECPEPLPSIEAGGLQWWEELRELGEPASGPMRVAAVLEEPPGVTGPADWEPWPLQRPLADFVLDPDAPIMAGQGVLLDAPDDVATLRAFRETFTAQFGPEDTIRALYIEDEGQHYLVYARDTAPVEDDNGLVPWLDGEL